MSSVTVNGNPENISIGSGIVFVGDVGVTPDTGVDGDDFGYLGDDGITLSYQTTTESVRVGIPAISVREFVTEVTATLAFQSREWKFTNFQKAVVGTYTPADPVGPPPDTEFLTLGANACPEEVSILVRHCIPCTDDQIDICIWRAQSDGAIEWQLNNTTHVFNYTFNILLSTTDWAGAALAPEDGLLKFSRAPQ